MTSHGNGEGSEERPMAAAVVAAAEEEARKRDRAREWDEAAEAVAYDSCTWPPPVVAVCGPGNSGKSAFCRLLLNTLVGRCFFFGDSCAKKNPKLLLSYIFSLYDYFLKELYRFEDIDNPKISAIPLVINTSGWVKGTGLHMLTEVLNYASPTHVIRLRTSVEGKNLPGGMFWLDEPEGDSAINLVEIRV